MLIIGLTISLANTAQADLVDPTQPPGLMPAPARSAPAAPKGPRWRLHSILISPQRRSAVINEQLVGLGDRINGAVVIEIQASSVRLRSRGRDVTLALPKQDIKTLSKEPHLQQGN